MRYLEITPPISNQTSLESAQELFVVLHSLISGSGFQKFKLSSDVISLEIVSTKSRGIRYIVVLPDSKFEVVKSAIFANLPEVKIKEIADYLDGITGRVDVYKQTAHFAYPLKCVDSIHEHDNLTYLTGSMTKLKEDELVAFQLLIKASSSRKAGKLLQLVRRNEDIEAYINYPARKLSYFINKFLFGLTDVVSFAYHAQSKNAYSPSQKENFQKHQALLHLRPARILSPFEQEQYEAVHSKLEQPLFKCEIRTFVIVAHKAEEKRRRQSIKASLNSYSDYSIQRLRPLRARFQGARNSRFKLRAPSLLGNNVLSAGEISALWHFPIQSAHRTENLNKSLSRSLPAPVSLKNNAKLDILLGVNKHHGSRTAIGLSEAERQRHIYIVGGTGNGKTTMLQYAIVQDIQAGKGLAVLDPHGDLAESLLGCIPKERINDVVYFNPDDITYPIGMNLLEIPDGLSGDELLREKDLITESAISVMRKIFSEDDTGGHRIEYILRNTIQTALTLEKPTLFTIYDLLNDTKFRRKVVRELKDKDLVNFWKNELGKAGEFQRVKMAAGITAKIGRFLFSASAKRVLEQEKSTIDFDDIMSSGKILICNFSKGLLGEDTSTLFGTTVLAKLQMASLRRARLRQESRKPFYLYVDEFQNFATMSFVQMLSEARKYKLFLTMAEQSTSQQDYQRLVDIILANVGTLICFRTGSPADERLLLPLFRPFIEENEIPNLAAYNFYMRIAALDSQEPFSGETILLDQRPNQRMAQLVKRSSRRLYAIKFEPKIMEENKTQTKSPIQLVQQPIDI